MSERHQEHRPHEPEEAEVKFYVESFTGLAQTQVHRILEAIKTMSDSLNTSVSALQAELADTKATVDLIAGSFDTINQALADAKAANDALTAQVAALEADATVSAATIASLNESATSAATAIDAATTGLNDLDESLETVSGENPPA